MFINIKFPITDDVKKNFLMQRNETTMDGIKSNLMLLLITEKGTRYFQRDYGTDLRRFLFEQSDEITQSDIIDDIKLVVKKYMPKINIDSIVFESIKENRVLLTITFTYTDDFYTESNKIEIVF
jgi:phage baseplate assembly protein W